MKSKDIRILSDSDIEMSYIAIEKTRAENYFKHCHENYELIFFLSNTALYVVEDKVYAPSSGDFILIAPGKFHFLRPKRESYYERMVLGFYPELLDKKKLLDDIKGKGEFFSKKNYPELSSAIEKIALHSKNYSDDDLKLLIKCKLTEIFLAIAHLPVVLCENEPNNNSVCTDAIRYISDNMSTINGTDDIAKALFVSKSSLQHSFRKNMDISLMQYVKIKRLVAAKLLITNGYNAKYAAEAVGYKDYSTFFRGFKTYFGYSPADASKN